MIKVKGNKGIISSSLSFVQNSATTSFVQNSSTSSFVLNSQTGSFLNTGIISSSQHVFSAITSSGDISASGLISAANFHVPGQGRISFDNTDTDDQFIKGLDNSIVIDGDDTVRLKADNYVEFADNSNNAKVSIDGNNGHMTASGNISASGDIIGTINGGNF